MLSYVDSDGYEWLPCHDGTYVAVAGDGYYKPQTLSHIESYYGPLVLKMPEE